ncbi:EexN family lipoprotein [Salmonella enterica]|nr:EexN family lipoprotein [Salmonella enterica]
MKFKFALIVLTSIIFISGCDEKYSKEWFINHHPEMISKYTECLLDNSWSDQICQNARNALHHESDKPDVKEGLANARKKLMEKVKKEKSPGIDWSKIN